MRRDKKALFFMLVVLAAVAFAPGAAIASTTAGFVGQGWGEILGCAACIAGGIILAAEGPGAIIIAAYTPGSAVALAACIAVCVAAVQ